MTDRRSILLLCDEGQRHASNVLQHIAAFRKHSRHGVHTFNPTGTDGTSGPELDDFDVVVIHYTLVITIDWYLPPALRERVAHFRGLKVQFIQDEYRWIDPITAGMRELGIDLLFTLAPQSEVEKIYGARLPGVKTVTTLAGYVSDDLVGRATPALEKRPLDVGYRGRTPPHWLGRIGQEKAEIGRGFLERAARYGLRCDIGWSETDRIYGERWIEFLTSCRATLGTESGATIADYDGSVEQRVREYLAADPTASFEEVEQDVLAPYEGNINLKVISPRQFEAAALRTALILFPGGYSGILEPDRHYIPLAKDFSNIDDVAERLRDLPSLQAMVDRAYDDLVASRRYSLEAFIRDFDELIAVGDTPVRAPSRIAERRPRRVRPGVRHRLDRAANRGYKDLCFLVGLRLIARRRALRRLVLAWARAAEARRIVDRRRLVDDLLKLALILDAQSGRLPAGTPFRVQPRYDEGKRRLMLGSRPAVGGDGASSPDGEAALPAIGRSLREGSLQEITWNHAAIGEYAWAPLPAGRKFAVAIGYHGMNGVHSFRALVLLSGLFPDLVLEALEPVLVPELEAPPGAALERLQKAR
jgi:hypothetical protein